ncbi:MAG: hypothetical protein QXL94_09060 [Candidatus Parvarchaeum sp.]
MDKIDLYGLILIIALWIYYVFVLVFNLFSVFTPLSIVLVTILYILVESSEQDKLYIERNSKDLYTLLNRNKRYQSLKKRLNNVNKYPNAIFRYFLMLSALLFGLVFTLYIGNNINANLFDALIIAISIFSVYISYLIVISLKSLWNLKYEIREILIKRL